MRTKNQFPKLKSRALLSPMAGVTDVAFRTLAKQYGAGLTYTEFVSSSGIVRNNKNTLKMVETSSIEKPVAVQLFGNNIEEVIEAAKLMEKTFDIIDINCGCPAWKVIKTGAGSAMLNDENKIGNFINKLSSSINKPVTLKIRTGIDDKKINAVKVAKIAEENGAAAIAIHGRTQKQGYNGIANWNIIKDVKDSVSIPVIGNGDIFTPEIFKEKLDFSNVDFIMIARAAIGNPFIFKQINEYLKNGTYEKKKPLEQFSEFIILAEKYDLPYKLIKNHAISFTKGLFKSSRIREELSKSNNIEEINNIFSKI